jgi:hypothetical protein
LGYDIEFRFDPKEKYDKKELLDRFVRAGASLEHDHGMPRYHDPIILMPAGYGAFLNPTPEAIREGRWVDGRCPRNLDGLERYVQFADAVRARLYDPQANIYVTIETIPQVLASLNKFMGMLGGLIGGTAGSNKPEP